MEIELSEMTKQILTECLRKGDETPVIPDGLIEMYGRAKIIADRLSIDIRPSDLIMMYILYTELGELNQPVTSLSVSTSSDSIPAAYQTQPSQPEKTEPKFSREYIADNFPPGSIVECQYKNKTRKGIVLPSPKLLRKDCVAVKIDGDKPDVKYRHIPVINVTIIPQM